MQKMHRFLLEKVEYLNYLPWDGCLQFGAVHMIMQEGCTVGCNFLASAQNGGIAYIVTAVQCLRTNQS